MSKRTIEVSRAPAHLAVSDEQLKIRRHEDDGSAPLAGSVPCEDVGVVVVDELSSTYSHYALARLMEYGAAVVICGRDHLPNGLLLPTTTHSEVVWRVRDQMNATRPRCKRIWQQLVREKIRHQAAALSAECVERKKLLTMSERVRSGDPDNLEAQAAKVYWSAWPAPGSGFRRDPEGDDGLNRLLNYGYAVLRAAVGRSVVAAGLMPAVGIHHSNRSNPFCLADDLLEPLRPLADGRIRELHEEGQQELNRSVKARLLEVLTVEVDCDRQRGPLTARMPGYIGSLVRCLRGESQRLAIPRPMTDRRREG